jgi:transaldolase
MDFWLATANMRRIETCLRYGFFKGVITNPHVVSLENKNKVELFRDIISIADIAYFQLKDGSTKEMLEEAERMLSIDPEKIRIKVPASLEGIEVIRRLADRNIPTMATVVPTSSWMLLASAAGAKQIAPYSGMLQKRNIMSKMEGVIKMQKIIDRQQLNIEICTGIYHATEIETYAEQGIKSGFIWEKDVESFLRQDLVDEAIEAFHADWQNIENY